MIMRSGTKRCARSGMTAVLAMLYLTLMASLALGFYSASNTAALVSFNEQKAERARLASESGLDFARFQLMRIAISGKTPKDQHFSTMASKMAANINGSGNVNQGSIYLGSNLVRVPADPNAFIKSDDKGGDFQFVINDLGNDLVEVQVVGRYAQTIANPLPRGVRMDFALEQKRSHVMDFGLATRGRLVMSGGAAIRGIPDPTKGSILLTSPTSGTIMTTSGNTVITGDISATNPDANFSIGSGTSVGGSTGTFVASHVHKGTDDPEFPEVDNSIFKPFATNKYVPGKLSYTNIYIPPNTNPSFASGVKIQGVVYVASPNKVSFSGQSSITGVIAVDTDNPVGNLSTNQIVFSGGTTARGVEYLDESFGDLRKLTGSFILAPGYSITLSGGFDAAGGAVVADKLTMSGGSDITVGTATIGLPAGLKFSNHYLPLPSTYDEVKVK